jgi:serine/threonine protein kinase
MTLARIGRFQVERMLGTGSFATVWLARDEDLDAWVAIKLLAENWSLNPDARRRFMEEARALRQLDHDRIVRVYEVGRLPDDRPYMVMEYADRGSLEERMRLRAQLNQGFSVREAVTLSIEIAECLASVHDLRIVHRDVKPSNILFRSLSTERQDALRREGKPVVTERTLLGDFGIARRLEGVLAPTKVVGSPQYMAPEQADPDRARLVDQRGDIYSAAVVAYELLAGGVPQGHGAAALDRSAPPIESARPDIPPSLARAIERALAADPDDRFPTAWDWRAALERSLETAPVSEPVASVRGGPGVRPQDTRTLAGGTMAGATRKQTALLEEPATPTRPDPGSRSVTAATGTLGLRPYGTAMVLAGLAMLVALFVPVSSRRSLSGVSVTSGSVSITAAWITAASALVLLSAGLQLWRARRRWAARAVSAAALLAGLGGLAVAGWVAVAVLTERGEAGPQAGLYVLAAAAAVGALAGSAASRRLRPPLVTAPATGR